MMTAEEFVLVLDDTKEENNFKLATVVDLFENNTAKIKFDGEDVPSEKQYAYLKSYTPEVGDRILLATIGGTYIILGKVNFNESPETEEEFDRYLFDLKKVNILKGLEVSGATTFNDGLSVIGDIGVDGDVMATGISATGQISAGNINTLGTLSAGATTLSGITVNGSASLKNGLSVSGGTLYSGSANIEGTLSHRGSYLGFFGNGGTSKKNVSQYYYGSGGADLASTVSKLNELIRALQSYGLIGGS